MAEGGNWEGRIAVACQLKIERVVENQIIIAIGISLAVMSKAANANSRNLKLGYLALSRPR